VAPWATICAFVYWGYDNDARDYESWEFSAQPVFHLPSLALSAALLVAGICAYCLSSWRIASLSRHLSMRRRVA
jgi:uncharacterized membrane protein YdfJ with MMPL/SSD domain